MKQSKIINSYKIMETLANIQDLSQDEQWAIYQLRKMLRSHFEFQIEREEAIREKYVPLADKDGNLSAEDAKEYFKEMEDLGNLEIEMPEVIKPKIRLVKGISFLTAEQLEDFIDFIPC